MRKGRPTWKANIPELSGGLGHVTALDRDLPLAAAGLHLGLGHGRRLHVEILLERSQPVRVGANLRFSHARGLVDPAVALRTSPKSRIPGKYQENARVGWRRKKNILQTSSPSSPCYQWTRVRFWGSVSGLHSSIASAVAGADVVVAHGVPSRLFFLDDSLSRSVGKRSRRVDGGNREREVGALEGLGIRRRTGREGAGGREATNDWGGPGGAAGGFFFFF